MPAHRAAFTLLEICLTLAISMVLILLGVPSVAGLLAEQRLHDSFARFEQLATTARTRSLQEKKPYRLLWEGDGKKSSIVVEAVSLTKGDGMVGDRLALVEGEVYEVNRVAALVRPAPAEWTFWPDGTREPVIVSYRGPSGKWQASFDAWGTHATFLQSEVP